ncbi:MAG TPA: hypothetical protein VIZ31_08265 [Vicinamibacteria bacterium]
MSDLKPFELGIAILGQSLVLMALVGLLVRKHIAVCWSFGLYLAAVLVTDVLMFLGGMPAGGTLDFFDSYDTLKFWLQKETVLSALKFAVAFELIGRAFSKFPGAYATARRMFWLVVGLTVISTLWVAASWNVPTGSREEYALVVAAFQPRVLTATTWLFVSIAGLILWYRLPIVSMAKAILIGFVPYLLLSYLVLELRTANQWPRFGWLNALDTWAWILLLGYWARSAWQPFREIMPRGRQSFPAVVSGSAG